MNKKGMTLVELLVTITLVGTVLSLLLSVSAMLKREEIDNNNSYEKSLAKLKFVRSIQEDFQNNELIKVEDASNDNLIINFIYASGISHLNVFTNKAIYTNLNGDEITYEIKDINISNCAKLRYKEDSNKSYLKINIPLNNKNTNKEIDNIEITYANKMLLEMDSNNIDNEIGACTN